MERMVFVYGYEDHHTSHSIHQYVYVYGHEEYMPCVLTEYIHIFWIWCLAILPLHRNPRWDSSGGYWNGEDWARLLPVYVYVCMCCAWDLNNDTPYHAPYNVPYPYPYPYLHYAAEHLHLSTHDIFYSQVMYLHSIRPRRVFFLIKEGQSGICVCVCMCVFVWLWCVVCDVIICDIHTVQENTSYWRYTYHKCPQWICCPHIAQSGQWALGAEHTACPL